MVASLKRIEALLSQKLNR